MARYPLGARPPPRVQQRKTTVKSSRSCSVLPTLLQRGAAPHEKRWTQECKHSVAGLVSICAAVAPAPQPGSPWFVPQLPPQPPCAPPCSLKLGACGTPSFAGSPVASAQSTPRPLSPKGGGFDVCELHLGGQTFDPTSEAVKTQLTSKLGVGQCVSIEAMPSATGGLNEGMWIMRTSSQRTLVLKLVGANRQEGSKLVSLTRSHPSIVRDPTLAFPLQVFHCLGAGGTKRYDLIVMEKAQGKTLADFIGNKWYSQGADPIIRVMRKLGSCLREFHTRYRNSQHGDFQPSNIFYDEAADKLTFIDVADIGTTQTHHNDKQHLLESLRILSRAYGPKFVADATAAFEAGYAR